MAGRSGAGKVRAAQIRNTNITAATRSSRSRSRRRRPLPENRRIRKRPGAGPARCEGRNLQRGEHVGRNGREHPTPLIWPRPSAIQSRGLYQAKPAHGATAGCAHRRSGRLAIAIACKKIHYTCIFMEARIRMAGGRSFFAAITAHFCRTTTPCDCDVAPPAGLSRRERLALVFAAVGNCADQCPACALWVLEQDERQERPVPDPARTTFERRPSC